MKVDGVNLREGSALKNTTIAMDSSVSDLSITGFYFV